jgi:hypothetical protein
VDRIEGWGGIALFMNNDEGSSGVVTHDVLSFGYGSHTFGPDIELNQISV